MDDETLFESLHTELGDIYQMALDKQDLLSAEFEHSLSNELRQLDQRYTDEEQINRGGMKRILKVEDRSTGRFVAMALLHKDKLDNKNRERFLREARLTAALEHPNVMPVYDIGLDQKENPFFTMKLTGGKNLGELIRSKGCDFTSWPLQQRLNQFLGICEGLAYAHSRHVLHLDLKPQNIQVGDFGEVLICDWGLGKILFDDEKSSETARKNDIDPGLFNELSMDGLIKGTPGYMAPEQIELSRGERDIRTDIYALGGVLHSLLSAKSPTEGKELQQVFDNTLKGNRQPLSQSKFAAPAALQAVVAKAMHLDPQQRYQQVTELRDELFAYISGFATEAEGANFARNLLLLIKRHRIISISLGVILILSLGFILRLGMSERKAQQLLGMYESEKAQLGEVTRDAAPHLVAESLRSVYSMDYDRALELINNVTRHDPQNEAAWLMKGKIHFYHQQFQATLAAFKKAPNHNPLTMRQLAQKYGSLKSDEQRLSAEHLITLLGELRTQEQKRLLFRHQALNYSSIEEHMRIIRVMLHINNPQVKQINMFFSSRDGRNVLDLSNNPKVSEVGCIRLMPLHELNVEGLSLNHAESKQFRGMPLEELNIVGTKINKLDFLASLPNLKKLTISKGAFPQKQLQKVPYEVEVILK